MKKNRMPVLFVGHGNPMNAIEDNEFSLSWEKLGQSFETLPSAIVCISAHWETYGPHVTAMPKPKTIHDFYGFPQLLYEKLYPAPGSPELAQQISQIVKTVALKPDLNWGLDHGTWSVLTRMFPQANIPVVQLSLDHTRDGEFHYDLGRQLGELRDQGVLIIGSGNIVHNLRMIGEEDSAFDWALDFDLQVKQWISDNDHDKLIHYEKLGNAAGLSINSAEHYLPLLYVLGLKEKNEPASFSNEKIWGGSISMRCVRIG